VPFYDVTRAGTGACPYEINFLAPLTRAAPTISLEGEGLYSLFTLSIKGEGGVQHRVRGAPKKSFFFWLVR